MRGVNFAGTGSDSATWQGPSTSSIFYTSGALGRATVLYSDLHDLPAVYNVTTAFHATDLSSWRRPIPTISQSPFPPATTRPPTPSRSSQGPVPSRTASATPDPAIPVPDPNWVVVSGDEILVKREFSLARNEAVMFEYTQPGGFLLVEMPNSFTLLAGEECTPGTDYCSYWYSSSSASVGIYALSNGGAGGRIRVQANSPGRNSYNFTAGHLTWTWGVGCNWLDVRFLWRLDEFTTAFARRCAVAGHSGLRVHVSSAVTVAAGGSVTLWDANGFRQTYEYNHTVPSYTYSWGVSLTNGRYDMTMGLGTLRSDFTGGRLLRQQRMAE